MSNFDNWYHSVIGRQIDIDGAFGDQCVDIVMSWSQFCYPGHQWPELIGYGDAKDLYGTANAGYFDKFNSGQPRQGDMVVFGPTPTNQFGHIAVVISADGSHMNVIEQNGFNPSGVAYTAQRPYNNVIGFLRPKGEDMIQDSDNEYSRWAKLANQIRGRRAVFTRDEFRNSAVGRSWLNAMEILSDDPEADTYFDRGHTNDGDTTNLYRTFLDRDPEDSAKAYRFSIFFKDNFYDISNSPEATALRAKKAADAAAKDKLITDLKTQVENGKATVDPKLQSQLDKIDQTTTDTKNLVQRVLDAILSKFTFSKKK